MPQLSSPGQTSEILKSPRSSLFAVVGWSGVMRVPCKAFPILRENDPSPE